MSVNPFNKPLSLSIKPSRLKWAIIIVPHLLALVMVVSFDVFSVIVTIMLVSLIALSATYYSRLHLFRQLKKSVHTIQQDSANNWGLSLYDDGEKSETISAILSASSFISNSLIVLNYRDNTGSQYSVIIPFDSLSSNDFRRLRVRLKLINTKNN